MACLGTWTHSKHGSCEDCAYGRLDWLVFYLGVPAQQHTAMRKMLTCPSDLRPVTSGRLLTGEPPCKGLSSRGFSDTAANGEMRAYGQTRCSEARP